MVRRWYYNSLRDLLKYNNYHIKSHTYKEAKVLCEFHIIESDLLFIFKITLPNITRSVDHSSINFIYYVIMFKDCIIIR